MNNKNAIINWVSDSLELLQKYKTVGLFTAKSVHKIRKCDTK